MVFVNAIPLVDYNGSSAKLCAFVDCGPGPDDVGHIVGAMGGKHNDRGDHLEHIVCFGAPIDGTEKT